MARNNLTDEIKSLINPEPIQDIENNDQDENTLATRIFEVDLNKSNDDPIPQQLVSKIRRNQVVKLSSFDKRYAGKKVQRQELDESFDEEESNGSDSDEYEEDEEQQEIDNDDEDDHQESSSEDFEINEDKDLNILNDQNDLLQSKALSVRNQLSIYESLMGSRIKLQKLLNFSNRLPSKLNNDSLFKNNEEISQLIPQLIKGLQKLQNTFLEIDNFIGDNNQINHQNENQLNKSNKRKMLQANESNLNKRFCSLKKYYPDVMDKWHEKTKLVHTNVNLKKFDSFSVVPSKVIEQILADKERLINRTRIKRNDYKIIGEQNDQQNEQKEMANIFDDDDFYHTILRQIIDNKLNIGQDLHSSAKKLAEIQRLRAKSKKVVDTKASKGRKIRYDVIEKLVNFMAPQDKTSLADEAKNDLFKSLFGKFSMEPV